MPSDAADIAEELLHDVVTARGGDAREGQVAMARAVAEAFDRREHLLVEAGTGTGKSFAYLVPAVAHGEPVVVATATKSLQDQLGEKDLPAVAAALADRRTVTWAVVKGRGSYLCRARLSERLSEEGWTDQGALFNAVELPDELGRVLGWSEDTTTGDRDELPFQVEDWGDYSVGGMECPGRETCPFGAECFAFEALDRAADADVIVVNHHLYAAHMATEGAVLPPHKALIVDEAHRLEDTVAGALGIDLAPWRLFQLTRSMRMARALIGADAARIQRALAALARDFETQLRRTSAGRFSDLEDLPVADAVERIAVIAGDLGARLRSVQPEQQALSAARARMLRLVGHLAGDVAALTELDDQTVAWIEGGRQPAIKTAPIDVAGLLQRDLYGEVTMVGTSATLSLGGRLEPMAARLGLGGPTNEVALERVPGPFDYARQTRLYLASDLPDPRTDEWREAIGDTVLQLVDASGGRALVLCTSRRNVDLLAERLVGVDHRVLVQGELGANALREAFAADETSVLVATMGFWEGLDVPGRSLQLVAIDRVPFPRPDDPLWAARREASERAGRSAFRDVDLPRAATLLAQGAGRLIRSRADHGVVAILDPRVARAGYGRELIAALPPMPVTTHREEAEAFLAALR